MNAIEYIAAGLGILWVCALMAGLLSVIMCGITRCPRCGRWHVSKEAEQRCWKGQDEAD